MPEPTFTIMTYNVGNERLDPEALVAQLRATKADIVGLQELTAAQSEAIGKDLKSIFPYQTLYGEGIPGKGVLSAYPIFQTEQLHLYPQRPDLLASVEIEGRPLRIIVAHPLPPRFHRRGFSFLEATHHHVATLTELAASGEPTVLMGDFNMLNWDKRHANLKRAGLKDAFLEAGRGTGYTLPTRVGRLRTFPFMRVDYIWVTRHLQPVAAWPGPVSSSDHLPVLARVVWQAPQN